MTNTAYDVVCHMEVDEEDALWTSEHRGKRFFFCHPGCKEIFDRDPELFVE